jgi:hypothetical protein
MVNRQILGPSNMLIKRVSQSDVFCHTKWANYGFWDNKCQRGT